MITQDHLKEVDINKVFRIVNLGATCMVTAEHDGIEGAMPATWVCPLDLSPTKVTATIAKDHFTRPLIEKSGYFAVGVPTVAVAKEVLYLGTVSKNDEKDKLAKSGATFFYKDGFKIPLMDGCIGYLICKVIPEPRNQEAYDLFIGECIKAYADERVYSNNHINFKGAPKNLRTLHYCAGSHFFGLGDEIEGEGLGIDEE